MSMQDVVFNFLTTDDIHLNQIDAEDPEVTSSTSCSFLEFCWHFVVIRAFLDSRNIAFIN